MTLALTAWIGIAGGVGSGTRFVVDGLVRARLGRRFPFGTLLINTTGSLLLGCLTGFTLYRHGSALFTSIGGVGFCGGFTTFSTTSFETVRLLQESRHGAALLNGLGTLAIALGAAAVGLVLVRP